MGVLLIVFYGFFFLFQTLANSAIFSPKNRINIVFYNDQTRFLSFSRVSPVNYTLTFDNELKILVPGGYGRYRIGALGRLSDIDKKPEIIQRGLSSATSSYVDYYFLPKNNEIYDVEKNIDPKSSLPKLSLMTVLFARDYDTNAQFFDRLYLFFLFLNRKKTDFISLPTNMLSYGTDNVFSEESFQKKYKGFFYQPYLRKEEKNVKLFYRKYKAAKTLSRIIEGEGIRVVDLERLEKELQNKQCVVTENKNKSKTAEFIEKTFKCTWRRGEVSGADISLVLVPQIEKNWE